MDFVKRNPAWVKKLLSVRGVLTQQELQGFPRLPFQEKEPPPKSIQVSRTYGEPLTEFKDVECAIIEHTIKAARTLRKSNLSAGAMAIFLRHGYRHHGECEYLTEDLHFANPLQSDLELTSCASDALRRIFKENRRITQGGIILCSLADANFRQRDLFEEELFANRAKLEKLSRVTDKINQHLGKRAIYPAMLAVPNGAKWKPAKRMASDGVVTMQTEFAVKTRQGPIP
jgi:DNA polymerase V